MNNTYLYIIIMSITLYLIRLLPVVLFRKPIKNKFIKSFLYFVPYVTLAVMSFPAIIDSTGNSIIGIAALVVGIITSYKDFGLFKVTVLTCLTVLLLEFFIWKDIK